MRRLPAYVSWSAFVRALDLLGPRAPAKVNSQSLGELSASTISQMLQAFKFLGLVDAEGKATSDLRLLVEHPESRQGVIAKVLRQSYPDVLGESTPPRAAAVEEFVSRSGLQPATQRKAVMFFLNAAAYAGIQVVAGTPEPSTAQPTAAEIVPTRSRRVSLKSGTVEVKLDYDPFLLTGKDRDFVFHLVDLLRQYEEDVTPEESEPDSALTDPHAPFENDDAPWADLGITDLSNSH